jgi:hypothetical protein
MDRRRATSLVVAVVALTVAYACGGSSPSSPSGSGSGTVGIQGVVLGSGSGSAPELTAAANTRSASGSITVTVEGAGITTTVSASGTFELSSVPAGTFTLVFTRSGIEIGRLEITASGGAEVKIVLQVQSSTLVVVNITGDDRHSESGGSGTASPEACPAISGGKVGQGIELEGDVSSASSFASFNMTVNGERASVDVVVEASQASFKCNGSKASDAECKATVQKGAKVHVRGTLTSCGQEPAVKATEVMVQKGA